MPLVGLLHDMGKIDALVRTVPQWAVVGDTFPLGCAFSQKNIFHEYFKNNSDNNIEKYQSELGIYDKNTGINNILMSYGHDEYAFRVFSTQSILPKEALSIIRFHSCYPIHRENAYTGLLSKDDHEKLKYIRAFNPYDLYSKSDKSPVREELEIYYKKLINKYFPPQHGEEAKLIAWPILKDVKLIN